MKKENISDVIDWFETEYRIMEEGKEYVNLRLYTNEDAVVFRALQYGRIAEVLKPKSLREKIYERVRDLIGCMGRREKVRLYKIQSVFCKKQYVPVC